MKRGKINLTTRISPKKIAGISPEAILNVWENYYGVKLDKINFDSRKREQVDQRYVLIYLLSFTPLTGEQVGYIVGGKDHSTVLHACLEVESKPTIFNKDVEAIYEAVIGNTVDTTTNLPFNVVYKR